MRNRIIALVKKELKGYFDSPTAYVLLVVWLAAASFFFFRTAFTTNEASLRPLFDLLPWLLLFFVPAATMRSLAAEKKDGTLEILLSHPISEAEVIIGKLASNVIFVLIGLALTLPIAIGLSFGGHLDIGMVFGQYLGATFMVIGLASVGLFASSLTRNQTVAFIISLATTFVLIVTGMDLIILALPFPLTAVARQISVLTHFSSMARGVITFSDIAYFAALAVIFAVLSYFGLRRERESRKSHEYKNLRVGTALIIVVCALVSLIGSALGTRLDLTSGRLYSLSDATVKMLGSLPDNVTLNLYASRQVPAEAETNLRDIKDMLVDYQAAGGGKVKTIFKSPEDGAAAQQEIQDAGIQLVQFNVVRQDEYQVKQGYLGLMVEYQNKRETIPFVSKTDNLEYQLSRIIHKLTGAKRPKIAFLSGFGSDHGGASSADQGTGYNVWRKSLEDQYEVTDLALKPGQKVPADIQTVIIAGPRGNAAPSQLDALEAFLKHGGSILALIDGLDINDKMMYVVPNNNNFSRFVAAFGFNVEPKLLFDMRANQTIRAGNQDNNYAMPYPFWMRVRPGSENPIVRDVNTVAFPWGQPLRFDRIRDGIQPLLVTSEFAGAQTKDFRIAADPNMKVDQNQLGAFVVAGARRLKGGGRIIVVGDSDFLNDRFIGAPDNQNGAFGVSAVDWLADDPALTGIRVKNSNARLLVFPSESLRELVRYLNLIGLPLAIALFGAYRLNRRRLLTRKVYAT